MVKLEGLLENTKFLVASIVAVAAITAGALFLVMSGRYSSSDASKAPAAANTPKGSAPVSTEEKARQDEMKSLEGHLQNKQGHPPILFRMAELSRQAGKLDDAAEYLKRILGEEPDNVDAHLELGRILYDQGDPKGAIAETEKILKKAPKDVDALYNLGAILANLGETDKAREYWKKAVASDAASESGKNAQAGLNQLSGAQPVQVAAEASPAAAVPPRPSTFDSSIRIPRSDSFRK